MSICRLCLPGTHFRHCNQDLDSFYKSSFYLLPQEKNGYPVWIGGKEQSSVFFKNGQSRVLTTACFFCIISSNKAGSLGKEGAERLGLPQEKNGYPVWIGGKEQSSVFFKNGQHIYGIGSCHRKIARRRLHTLSKCHGSSAPHSVPEERHNGIDSN